MTSALRPPELRRGAVLERSFNVPGNPDTPEWLERQSRVTGGAQAALMLSRPLILLPVLLLVGVALASLLSLALPFPASLCFTLTAYALGYGLLLLGQTGRDTA
ncbi:hypothetical protein ACFFLM_12810 [Deinococcus oregonensis]|uniref:Uncharacterized protein n=1 Tax=Deinococcus oregonensis TaxID=1805970 RepID=A0ABV6AZC4_9DEIO